MGKQLKIAIYSGNIPSTTFIENLIQGLAQSNVKIFLFGKVNKKMIYQNKSNIIVYGIPNHRFKAFMVTVLRSFLLGVKNPRRLFKLLHEMNKYTSLYSKYTWYSRYLPVVLHLPDIFHIQWAKDLEYWLFLKSKFNTKIILSLLGSHINYSPKIDSDLAKSYSKNFPDIDAFHGVSKAIIKEAEYYNAQPERCKLIYTQIKPSTFELFKNNQRKVINTLKILSIGRHHWVKGYNYAIDAMTILKSQNITFEYTIIGGNEVPDSLLYVINDLKLEPNIIFKNNLPQEKLFKEMQSYDVLLLPSLNEGIANVVVEAMAIGLSVVSTNCGGMSEIVIPDTTGWLCNVFDPDSIAKSIIDVKETDVEKRTLIAENAHKLVKEKFYSPDIMKEFIDLYDSIDD